MNVNIEDKWGEHPNVRFNDDGTITDTQLEIVNLKMDGQWETVGESLVSADSMHIFNLESGSLVLSLEMDSSLSQLILTSSFMDSLEINI